MSQKRVQINNVVQNQLPSYVREDYPLVSEFLKQYYLAQEFKGAPIDLIQNIDQYIKLEETTNLTDSVILYSDLEFDSETIEVDIGKSRTGTDGFPDSYGLLKIGDEIITYTGKTKTTFTGCIRGFSGVSSLKSDIDSESLVFDVTDAQDHDKGSTINNLSDLFLKQFLHKTKIQILPGFEDRSLSSDLNENLFIKQAKDFYGSKGTDRSFEILFKALYNERVEVVKPRDYLFTPSESLYKVTNDLVVEAVTGDPTELTESTLFQDAYLNIDRAYSPVTYVEKVVSGIGQTYYKLSFDAGYNRDIGVKGATYGAFTVHPKTSLIGQVSAGATILNVDSTVGFAHSGELSVTYSDATIGVVSYTSKSIDQFFGCSLIEGTIKDGTSVGINTYAYGLSVKNPNEIIEVRVNSVLSQTNYPDNTRFYSKGDTARIKSLGVINNSFKSRNWFYNVAPTYEVSSVELIDASDQTYTVTLKRDHYFKIGDSASIIGPDNVEKNTTVIDTKSARSLVIKGQGALNVSLTYTIKRRILRGVSNTFAALSQYKTNVQNTYASGNKLLIASSSIPSYDSQPLDTTDRTATFSGSFVGSEFAISTIDDHGFYTGDAVYYTPQIVVESYNNVSTGSSDTRRVCKSSLFSADVGTLPGDTIPQNQGLYYVSRVNSTTVKLAKSKTDVFNNKFISLDDSVTVTDCKLTPYRLRLSEVKSQKLFREIDLPVDDGEKVNPTVPGTTGILINGVEILNYKSTDVVRHGRIENIEVISGGSGYDIIDPPTLNISDSIGVGASGNVAVSGSLEEIRVEDSGFDYLDTPIVTITGGNGTGARASVNMKLIEHSVNFNSESASSNVNLTDNTIGFGTFHKFRNVEQIIYKTEGQRGVGGIATNAVYYASTVNNTTVQLHNKLEDAIAGINTISLTAYGFGRHSLQSYNKKSVVESVNVISSGEGYQNKLRSTNPAGIVTSSNSINIENHDYQSGEIVVYTAQGTAAGGIVNGSRYVITREDENNFKLSSVGLGSTATNFYYNTNQYINLSNSGVGTHSFNYDAINVNLSGRIGISSIGGETFEATIQPIFRGEITSVHLNSKGVGYGSSEVINFDRQPNVELVTGKNAQLEVVVNNGKVAEVLVLNAGSGYNSTPDITIDGDGIGAVLCPVVSNGQITSVNVLESGTGYLQGSTTASIEPTGSGAVFNSNLQNWRFNLFARNLEKFTGDDGYITSGRDGNQYAHLYAPRNLREVVFSVDQDGSILYGNPDLKKVSGTEVSSTDHSPIIGWAYDGNPIYGPYGYLTKTGGTIAQMKSSYKEEASTKENRPSLSSFPAGFFIEDYTFVKVTDETFLDENNGRFCITPEYPNGTYAYFATVNDSTSDTSGSFSGFRRPVFPYLIGENYKSVPNPFNFTNNSNQDSIDLNETTYLRNTDPLNLIEGDVRYSYLPLPNDLNQTVDVTAVSPGTIQSIGINTGGDLYRVGDKIVFDNNGTQGSGADARVSRVKGKQVSSVSFATSSITGLEVAPGLKGNYTLIADSPHQLQDQNLIVVSGVSTTSSRIEGSYVAGITTNTLTVAGFGTTSSGIGTDGVTGIVTFFNVTGNLSNFRENDILTVGSERVRILNVDNTLSRIRVLRSIDGTTGAAHTVTTVLTQNPRTISITAGFNTSYSYKANRQLYFNPTESVAIGTAGGVGVGTTIAISNPGAGVTQVFVPNRSVYIPNHGLETGDQLTYSPNAGSGIELLHDTASGITTLSNSTTLFVAKLNSDLIGLSTVRVGLGTTGTFVGIASTEKTSSTVFFTGFGTGVYHSLKTNYSVITANVDRSEVTVATASSHGLHSNHSVFVDVNPSNTGVSTIKYNDYNRRLVIDPLSFTAAGVNTSTNVFTIANHGFVTGQKIIHTATTPSAGLSDQAMYYIIKVDTNTFKLANSYHESLQLKPEIVGVTSASAGTINPVNPPITLYTDSTTTFDLTDTSLSYTKLSTRYPAFELNFYLDENFNTPWEKSPERSNFNVLRVGKAGVSTDAKVTLSVDEQTPTKIFYKLDPVFESDLPTEKNEIFIDNEVASNNEIKVRESVYNGKHTVSIGSSTQFSYTISEVPEKTSYTPAPSRLTYDTDCEHAYGSIAKFDIKNPGRNYYSLPGISTITTTVGKNAIVEADSTNIGVIKKTKINNIGFNFPSDKTVRPNLGLVQIIGIDPLTSIESIGITSIGRGYTQAPGLLLFDGKTDQLIDDVDLRFKLGDPLVTIFKNTTGISNVTPKIIPVNNTNGVGISTVGFNTITQDVSVTLSQGFSSSDTFPFEVGNKVLVEGISVGVGSTGKGYNSANYDYKLFELTGVEPNLGGIGIVTFSLSGLLNGKVPGAYDTINSAGRIIPEKFFPLFDVKLKKNDFLVGETVEQGNITGVVEDWNPKIEVVKISSNASFTFDSIIKGRSSNTQGIASTITSFDSDLSTEASSRVESGWQDNTGFINDDLQRVQDSFYYQNFSYSLKSRVPLDTWEDAVGSLNHTLGFKKFSDYQLETPATFREISNNSMAVGLTTALTNFQVVTDIIGVVDTHCVFDFDLVKENALVGASGVFSNEMIFSSRILTDFFESVGNRVLSIDDMSGSFNSNPRPTPFSVVTQWPLNKRRAIKYITYVRDKRFVAQRQVVIVDLVHDDSNGYINQYAAESTVYPLGSFDFSIVGTDGKLEFYPNNFKVNDYDVVAISYNLDDNLLSIGSTQLGPAKIQTSSVSCVGIASTTIVSLATTYRSAKVLANITGPNNEFEMNELNIVHDDTDVHITEYGNLTTNLGGYVAAGFGSYHANISGSTLNVDFIPFIGIAATVNTIQVAISTDSVSGVSTSDLKHARLEARTTGIASASSPGIHTVGTYPTVYDAAYFVAQVSDTTNNTYQMSELVLLDDHNADLGTEQTYLLEYGNTETVSGLGTFGAQMNSAKTDVELMFTPNADITTQVKVYMNAFRIQDDDKDQIEFDNGVIETFNGDYEGTERSIKRSFNLTHRNNEIFNRSFEGNNTSIVKASENSIIVPNHFFVTGEEVSYVHAGSGTTQAIGIETTDTFVGIGTTDKVPSSVFIIKVNEDTVKLAATAANALKAVPTVIGITTVGIGTSHRFVAKNQNGKCIIALDNIIQSPVVSTATTTELAKRAFTTDDILTFTGITSFFGGDHIKIGDEIIRIEGVGIGSTNTIRVRRQRLGTSLAGHSTGALVTKVIGNYNIVENTLTFAEAPFGNIPLGTSTNPPDERDWTGISTSSSFQGRTFLRSGIQDSSNETYHENYVFDTISEQFNGEERNFDLKSNGSDVTGIATDNAVILINDIFQGPGLSRDYTLNENAGITSIRFTGTATSISSDANTSNLPLGGVIVSVGSTEGLGYQPLVAAGGTAVVSSAGTITSISIGNSGSGYRVGVQTVVNVAVASSSLTTPAIEFIGTAAISGGNIVSVAITNPGSGYNQTNPPSVVFDDPLSYSDIPLIYSTSSSGTGQAATADIVVGQGSSVIDFEIKNTGFGYGNGQILTVAAGGSAGIPTSGTFREFQIDIQQVFHDEFTGWAIGTLQSLDDISNLFTGSRTAFPLQVGGNSISIISGKGSNINVQDVLLVFVNDILQVPGEGYIFTGGSTLTFTEAPKVDDTVKILFYKGSGDVDVVFRNIIETVKVGDELTIKHSPDLDQPSYMTEDPRTVEVVKSTDVVGTNNYFGPGNNADTELERSVTWCRQTEDKIINEKGIGKDRELYEPVINPYAYIIQSVGVGSTAIYVDNIRPFFNPINENDTSLTFQDKVKFRNQGTKVGAAATAVVSVGGTISSITISDGGSGYLTAPTVSIGNTVGVGTTALATASITAGIVTAITITNAGTGYTQVDPPEVLIAPPTTFEEENSVTSYAGDSGVIVGFGTTTVSSNPHMMFDLFIPRDSFLRDGNVTGVTTVSGIGTGDFFAIYNSNVGSATTTLTTLDVSGNTVGIGSSFIDNVYQAHSVETVNINVTGIGFTDVRRVFSRVSENFKFGSTSGITTSPEFGIYNWGKILLSSRSGVNSYTSYTSGGVAGIETSTIVQRSASLKFKNYT